jgi:ABC-type Fe3+ transport system permease subunit/sugar lactone lactonase YvrE
MMPLWNTIWVAGGAAILAGTMGVCAALAWLGASARWRRWGLVVAGATLALPPFLLANCWLEISSAWRLAWGAEHSAIALLPLTALVLGSMHWPIPALLAVGSWSRIERTTLEAMPGLRGWRLMREVLWPAAARGLSVGMALCFSLAAANFAIPTLFQVRVLSESLWVRFNTQLDVGAAWRAGFPLVLMAVAVLVFIRRSQVVWPSLEGGVDGKSWRRGLGGSWLAGIAGAAVVVGFSMGIPISRLLGSTQTWLELVPAARAGKAAAWTSAGVAAVVAGGLLLLSLAAVRLGAGLKSARWLAWLWFLTPGILTSSLWVPILARPGARELADSTLVYWLVLGVRYAALVWSLVLVAADRVDRSGSDAMRVGGAGPLRSWWSASWPQMRGLALAGAYTSYLLVLWDVETVILIMPPGLETLSVRVFNLLHYGHAGQVNALCLVLLGLALLPLGLWGVARAGLARLGGMALGAFLLVGCSEKDGKGRRVPLESRWFSHSEIIGSRGVAPGQFNKPRSLVCDRDDNLYVADVTGRIQKFDRDGRFLLQWQMPQTDLGKPKGMGLDPEGHVLVIEPHYMRANHFDGGGKLLAQWGRKGTNPGAFILPRSVVVNSRGEYFLSEYTVVDRVQRFSAIRFGDAGTPVELPRFELGWGEPGAEPGRFNRAEGLGIGPDDAVYVADSCNHRIQVFDRDGRFLREHGRAGSAPGQFSYPYDIRIDARGTQFICEFGNSRITLLDAQDRLIEVIGGPGAAPGRFANPWSIAMDSRGNLYVADSQNHRVQKLTRRAGVANHSVSRYNRPG